MKKSASATWSGGLKEGQGTISTETGVLREAPFGFKSRFEDGEGTNPEELIGAALAGCFSMQLSAFLHNNGIESESVSTHAEVELRPVDGAPTITKITLATTVTAPGADESAVREQAEAAKEKCPVSRALGPVEKVLDLTLA